MKVILATVAISAIAVACAAFEAGMRVGKADVHDLVLLDFQTRNLAEMLANEALASWTQEDISEPVRGYPTANVSVSVSSAPRAAQAICPTDHQETDAFGARGWEMLMLHLSLERTAVTRLSCNESSIDAQLIRFPDDIYVGDIQSK